MSSSFQKRLTEARRGRPARRPPPTAGQTLQRLLGPHRKSAPPASPMIADIRAHWPHIVGQRLAPFTKPERLTGRGRDGVLHVAAQGPAAMLLEAESEQILERVTQYCGRQTARRIAIVRTAATPKSAAAAALKAPKLSPRSARRLDQALESVRDPGLKAALKDLGASVLAVRPATRRSS